MLRTANHIIFNAIDLTPHKDLMLFAKQVLMVLRAHELKFLAPRLLI